MTQVRKNTEESAGGLRRLDIIQSLEITTRYLWLVNIKRKLNILCIYIVLKWLEFKIHKIITLKIRKKGEKLKGKTIAEEVKNDEGNQKGNKRKEKRERRKGKEWTRIKGKDQMKEMIEKKK